MKAGTLDQRITLQRQAGAAVDDIGQPLGESWSDVAYLWANARHLSGIESIRAGAAVSQVKASMRIRYRAGIDSGMRVLLGSSVYQIEAVIPHGRREWIDLACVLTT